MCCSPGGSVLRSPARSASRGHAPPRYRAPAPPRRPTNWTPPSAEDICTIEAVRSSLAPASLWASWRSSRTHRGPEQTGLSELTTLKGSSKYWLEENAEGMLLFRAYLKEFRVAKLAWCTRLAPRCKTSCETSAQIFDLRPSGAHELGRRGIGLGRGCHARSGSSPISPRDRSNDRWRPSPVATTVTTASTPDHARCRLSAVGCGDCDGIARKNDRPLPSNDAEPKPAAGPGSGHRRRDRLMMSRT